VHLVGFIIRNLTRCTVTGTSNTLHIYSESKGVTFSVKQVFL